MQTQQPRAGRPRMEDPEADTKDQDEETSRRTRMRLAQRKYRSKKHDALAAAEQKATALESALRGTLSAIRGLQTSLLQQPAGAVPLDVAVAVSKNVSRNRQPLAQQRRAGAGHARLPAARLRPDDVRAARALGAAGARRGRVHPDVPGKRRARPSEMLPGATDVDYAARCLLPPLYRKVEGAGEAVLRLAPPKLQRLKYGLTRTWFDTDVPALAGEWLEAVDVEEYLAQRGIHVRDPVQKVVTLHLGGSDAGSEGAETPGQPWWEPEMPDWTMFGRQLDEQQDVPHGTRAVAPDGTGRLPTAPQGKITIDVDKLITGLSSRSICLGPAPGIRRHHVDEAIQEAVQI